MSKQEIIKLLKKYKEENSSKYGISTLGLYGSVSRDEDKPDSDIDIFIQTKIPNPFIIVLIKEELESIFHKHVDIVRLRNNMNLYLKERIEKEGIHV